MVRLLRSNILRLIKSKSFYIVLAIQAVTMVFLTINAKLATLSPGAMGSPDMIFKYTACSVETAVLLAAVCCLYIGADYSGGTIRNKLIIGHTRAEVYLANLVTVITVALSIDVVSMLIFYPVTMPLLGEFWLNPEELASIFFLGVLILLVYSSIFTALAMTVRNTPATLIISFALMFVMALLATYLVSEINAPATWVETSVDEFGEIITTTVPNPYRKSERVLAFFKVLVNLFPSGHLTVLGSDLMSKWQIAVSSFVLFGGFTAAGLVIFNRQNLK